MVRLNRRNVLVGMGAIVAGGGAALGTGAFSSVEASRTVSVGTDGDASALVGLNIASADLDGGGGATIEFDTAEDLNLDALTEFTDAFEITNNRDTGDISVEIEDEAGNSIVTTDAVSESSGMYFVVDPPDQLDNIGPSTSETMDIVFNLEGEEDVSSGNGAIPDSITIIANDV